ncbi:MAG TPA: hypothetical protein VNU93_03055, partial [Verrucomicrobiae bacterium]|nr:hypothetical protein [Verrucomicrobiae bacterium]
GEGDSLTSGTGTVVKKPDAAVRNVEGVVVDPATWTITGTTLYAQQDYQVCLKCHSKWAWGTSIPNIPSTYNGTTRTQENQTYAGEPLTVLDEFKPTNLSYHPLFRIGKNQPPLTANSNWTGTNRRLKSTETGGKKYWGGDGVTAVNGRPVGPTWYEPEGLDNTFVDGWGTMSLVSCSDCHGSNNATVEGPHGSSYKWLLKGSDPNITATTAAGVIQPNTPAYWANPTGNQLLALQANFCINCHRADVYGPGYGVSGKVPNLSRFSHQRNASDADSSITNKGNTLTPYGCTNCHGGFETGGIHGTSMPAQTGFTDASGKRFMNGASWAGHNLGTTTVSCTTASSSINTCSQHSNPSSSGTLNYSY